MIRLLTLALKLYCMDAESVCYLAVLVVGFDESVQELPTIRNWFDNVSRYDPCAL